MIGIVVQLLADLGTECAESMDVLKDWSQCEVASMVNPLLVGVASILLLGCSLNCMRPTLSAQQLQPSVWNMEESD